MIITGNVGYLCLMFCNKSKPDVPGMRMSETSTCGAPEASASIASWARAKVL